jgi:hypothetical protein
MDLLSTYTHSLELQAITRPLLISTIHKSPQHTSLFQPTVFSPAVPWQLLLTVEIIQLHLFRSFLHSFSCRTASQLSTLATNSRPFHTNLLVFSSPPDFQLSTLATGTDHIENTIPLLLYHCCICVCCCGNVFTEPLPRNGSGKFAYLVVIA